ncbi:hypothetical protein GCM10010254_71650 [Streptomyces chromofuscus]|nr:hypothetical protein GCM10010254_71650 [Streptomyces chromofuscus]
MREADDEPNVVREADDEPNTRHGKDPPSVSFGPPSFMYTQSATSAEATRAAGYRSATPPPPGAGSRSNSPSRAPSTNARHSASV